MIKLLKEQKLPQDRRINLIKEFVKFSAKELGIKQPSGCKISLTNDKDKTESYAHFNPNNNNIVVYVGNRNVGDICRSICHEQVHLSQSQQNQLGPSSGKDGSPQENDANTQAGIIMRKFGKLHPEIYE